MENVMRDAAIDLRALPEHFMLEAACDKAQAVMLEVRRSGAR